MIQEDEYIIYVSQAKCAVTIKEKQSMKTGMLEKKIVITTRRCLFFESISNQVQEIQFQIMRKKKNPQDQKKDQAQAKKQRVSINQFPENSFPINDRQCKIMIDQQPTCHKYLQKIGLLNYVKSVSGIVILKNMPKMKFQLLAFPSLKDGFRFCKALVCAKAWIYYEKYCRDNNIPINKMWVRIISEVANDEKSIVLIDPDLFLSGSRNQIKSFLVLINQIPFAHSFEHRYSIINQEIATYSSDMIQLFQEKTHSLIMRHNSMAVNNMNAVFINSVKLEHLMHLDLSHNKFTDEVFVNLQRLSKEGKKLSYFNLSHNLINLHNGTFLVNFLKATQIILTIDLTFNDIDDMCIDTIQKFVILPHNPPIEQINLSNNKLSKKGAWRLFIGNNRAHKYHTYLNFIIYPIPITPDIFPQTLIEYPTPMPLINFNIHSALVQEFQQQSFMKHTLQQILKPEGTTIKFIRRLPQNVKLPRTKQEVRSTLQLANKIQNFLYSPQFVQNMYDLAEEVAKFEFNLPPVSKMHFIKYLSDKLNQALFIRDHYSVKYILKAFNTMGVDYEGYKPRIQKVNARDAIVNKKMENIVNFQIDQYQINKELDQIVRQGLRLYLTGNGIQAIYYLKYLRDKWIERLLQQKYNPQHYIHEKMADKNMNVDDEITQKQLVIPYQIRVEKKINQNFYLHPWKTNYFVLSQILKVQYEDCLKFLQESSKRQKFAIYFERIQQRIQFMRNQFNLFSYDKFKCSYSDLKINCARLLAMYRFITQKNYYLQIPAISRKKEIHKEKILTIYNEIAFKLNYHISNYPNINMKAKRSKFYNYVEGKMTKYSSEIFHQQYIKFKVIMDTLFRILERQSSINSVRIPDQIIQKIIQIIKFLNQSIYPIQLKQEFYLRILSWRNGKHMTNTEILRYMPFLSMYIRPPLAMEKYIVAAILNDDKLNLGELPLSIVTDVNKATQANVQEVEKNYVERQWLANKKILVKLMKSNGKVSIDVQLLTKNTITLNVPQSKTVDEVVSNLIGLAKDIQDVSHFWLYMGYVGQNTLTVLEECQHIGEILCDKEEKQKYFLFKRRIFCPEWKYVYRKYSQTIINSLYYDVKAEYLFGQFFINDREMLNLAATMFIVDLVDKVTPHESFQQMLNNRLKNLGNYYREYMPAQAITRSMKTPSQLINEFRDKIRQKVLKKQNLKPLQCKKQILNLFEDYPEFLCSNYIFMDRNKLPVKASINLLNVYINTEQQIQKFGLQKIISIIPKTKFLLINYHKQEGVIGKVSLFGDQNKILSTAQDILAYCMIRVKMISPSLYSAFRYEFLMEKHVKVKEPTKDKQILDTIRRIKKRLATASPTILEQSVVPYFQACRYIKTRTPRKLYANASLEKLDIVEDRPQDYQLEKELIKRKKDPNDSTVDRHNVFRTILPNVMRQEDDDNIDEEVPSYLGRSVSEPYDLSAYNNINQSIISGPDNQSPTINDNKEPLKSSGKMPSKQIINQPIKQVNNQDEPPQLTPIKNKQSIPDEDFGTITTAQKNRTNRLPPKRNR